MLPERLFHLVLGILACGALTGCVRIYQPLSGLHRPVIVDPTQANFEGLRLGVRCVPEGLLNAADASTLCQKVGVLFENQGAVVTTAISAGDAPDEVPSEPPQLTLELRARKVHESQGLLSWALCIASFTVVPGVRETTFAQDVLVRDGDGFLLVSESLEGRLIERFGAGTWLANKVLDLAFREDDEKLTGDAANRDLSSDFYRQLSQTVFNAEMQRQILEQAPSSKREASR